ncbi:MAG: 3-deoxy-7-phosphoheptulonate synthase [Deltaproteobacteria bacterium]|nr:3-deoxy-7-phosphoheptulonate synthase [Deltaproteobacteria bacterium]
MLVTLRHPSDADRVAAQLQALGLWTERLKSDSETRALLVRSDSAHVEPRAITAIDGVSAVWVPPTTHPKLDALAGAPVTVRGLTIGYGAPPVLISGPCSIESPEQIAESARAVRAAGGTILRGGAFKPRTSPYAFSGHGNPALGWMRDAADSAGLAVVTEVLSERDVDSVADYADMLQIGSRNMQAFGLLKAAGRAAKPVLLKRGMAATVEEWLLSAEHLLVAGASGVVFCERGLRSFDPSTRNLLDLGAVALLANVYRLPVVVDPSHAAGRRDLIQPLARAALGAGAHGLIVECHPDPAHAKSDGAQALDPRSLAGLADACHFASRENEGRS